MMKGLRTFLYELKYAFLQMKRHIMLCFSAISAIGITLLLIGSILIIGLHVNYFSNDVQKDPQTSRKTSDNSQDPSYC